MTSPRSFNLGYVDGQYPHEHRRRELRWRSDDVRVERLWLPLLGPTPFCLLRMFHDDCEDLFATRHYVVADVAARVGTKSPRAWQSLLRLLRFAMLFEDDAAYNAAEDIPTYLLPYDVRPISEREWARLPATVRDLYGEMPL